MSKVTSHSHAQLHTHPNKSTLDAIPENSTYVTQTEKDTWNAKIKITVSDIQPPDGWWFKVVG